MKDNRSRTRKPFLAVILSRAKDPSGRRGSILAHGFFARLRMTAAESSFSANVPWGAGIRWVEVTNAN
jgi:hypothetical protein